MPWKISISILECIHANKQKKKQNKNSRIIFCELFCDGRWISDGREWIPKIWSENSEKHTNWKGNGKHFEWIVANMVRTTKTNNTKSSKTTKFPMSMNNLSAHTVIRLHWLRVCLHQHSVKWKCLEFGSESMIDGVSFTRQIIFCGANTSNVWHSLTLCSMARWHCFVLSKTTARIQLSAF